MLPAHVIVQGYGTFNALDFAMALDVVSDGVDSAKELGLWNLSMVRLRPLLAWRFHA